MKIEKLERAKIPWFIILLVFFVILKQILAGNLPLLAYPAEQCDDWWMISLAYNIAGHSWLGNFNLMTLMKELTGPIYLAICSRLGVSFIGTTTFLYSMGCIVFVYAIKDLFHRKWTLFLVYLVLLFNPASYAAWTLQRVYRCGLTLIEVLFLFGCFFALYIKRKKSTLTLVPWAIGAGISLAATYHTREDRIWIIPFVGVISVVLIINVILSSIDKGRISFRNIKYGRLILVIFPIISLLLSNVALSYINYKNYGLYTYNLIDDSNFSRAVSCFYRVKVPGDDELPRISVPQTKLSVLYEISPTLKTIQTNLDNKWAGQPENGMIIWPLIYAVNDSGYYETAQKADSFYKDVADEIESAIKNGKVESRAPMPSPLMAPWRKEYSKELPETMAKFTIDSVLFKDVYASSDPPGIGTQNSSNIRLTEGLTNDLALVDENDKILANKKDIVDRINNITPLYGKIFPILFILGSICYVYITVIMIKNLKLKINNKKYVDSWLVLSALILSYIVLIGGVSYNQVSAVESGYYMYRSGGYPLLIAFAMVASIFSLDSYISKGNSSNRKG